MIIAKLAASGRELEARLTAKARRIGETHAQGRRYAQPGLGHRWRSAYFLWPLF